MADRLAYQDTTKRIYVTTEATANSPQVERIEWVESTVAQLSAAVAVLRQWADEADAATVTAGNAVATLQTVVDRLGVFFDRFADLVEQQYR